MRTQVRFALILCLSFSIFSNSCGPSDREIYEESIHKIVDKMRGNIKNKFNLYYIKYHHPEKLIAKISIVIERSELKNKEEIKSALPKIGLDYKEKIQNYNAYKELFPNIKINVVIVNLGDIYPTLFEYFSSNDSINEYNINFKKKMYVQKDSNIRSGRSTRHRIVKKVKLNDLLWIDDYKNDWYACYESKESDKTIGFIHSDLVHPNKYVALTLSSDGYEWKDASVAERKRISKFLAKELNSSGSYYPPLTEEEMYKFLMDFYSQSGTSYKQLYDIYELAK